VIERLQKRLISFCKLFVNGVYTAPKLSWVISPLLGLAFCISQIHSAERLGARRKSSPPPTWSAISFDEDKNQLKATTFVLVYDSSIMGNEDSLKVMLRNIAWEYMQNKFPRATLVVALFAQKEYARPVRELKKSELKAWKTSYLARYDAWEKELIIFPEDPKKRRKISFDLCPDAKESSQGFYYSHCQGKKSWEK